MVFFKTMKKRTMGNTELRKKSVAGGGRKGLGVVRLITWRGVPVWEVNLKTVGKERGVGGGT